MPVRFRGDLRHVHPQRLDHIFLLSGLLGTHDKTRGALWHDLAMIVSACDA